MATTISVCALPLGGIAGSAAIFPDVLQKAAKVLKEAEGSLLTDSLVTHVADWLVLVMVHGQGGASPLITALKDAVVAAARDTADKRRLFCRDIQPVMCGMTFAERESEPFVLFLSSAASPAFWNKTLLSQFANPFGTPSIADGKGFVFCTEEAAMFQTPQDLHRLIAAAKSSAIVGVAANADTPVASAGPGVVMIARAEYPCPTTAELCGVFARPQLLPEGILCPVSLCDGKTVAKGVIPVVALGFSVADGKLSGPMDLFDNPAFNAARDAAGKLSGYL
ncbi:MAG TPA: fructose 1,6-bisphosphatase [Methanocorpusculum sp.]|nr:fructose-1,6-bisphosphatase [Candidatus Methanocorpusculum faecipullorum]HJK65022.1 fructose 1,6-bisphosphatase [Methanocorpusculum sp.]HJK72100.1 fructose 1,6-bisphosphatase [Methanocorpusculum sp.]HJK74873.1 fructose 1,6-bisphosphatase [Methanocorpusculum sp.]HJK76010.1 fructose 1,6-bisphosphatase [Methanocorpusculum sp.]